MSTPTESVTAHTTRARNPGIRLLDEEQGIGHDTPVPKVLSPGTESTRRRRLHDLSQQLRLEENKEDLIKFWDQFTRKGKRKIGVIESIRVLIFSSWLNVFLVVIPIAWVSKFLEWNAKITFTLCFFAIVPLEHLLDYGGEQMAYYLGKELGDLLLITLNNAVEATLAILLLKKCELVLLKSTVVGVVILHLLLVPGTSFVIGGARIIEQDLHPHLTQLNHSLLMLGVLSILLPAAFFAAIDTSFSPSVVTDETRNILLQMSRGLAILLLVVYVCSRVYLHNPPGKENSLATTPLAPELKEHVAHFRTEDPDVNQWVCICMLTICLGLLAATAEFMVHSIDFVRESAGIKIEWFGLILLPVVSFAADGTVAMVYFIRYMFRHFFQSPIPPTTLAKGEAIDLSIQFTLFWMPFFVLLGWWTNKPLTLLFDMFEVTILLGSCFLVNYITADAKTNWAEGVSMVIFYVMIALCAWFYTGQPEITLLSKCGSVAAALAAVATGNTTAD